MSQEKFIALMSLGFAIYDQVIAQLAHNPTTQLLAGIVSFGCLISSIIFSFLDPKEESKNKS